MAEIDITKNWNRTLLLSLFIIALGIGIPLTIGFGKAGFSDPVIKDQFYNYAILTGVLLFGIFIAQFWTNQIAKKHPEYGLGVGFANQGEFPALDVFKRYSMFQIFLLSLIIFGMLGTYIFVFQSQTAWTGVLTAQQFGPFDNITFSSFLVPVSENLIAGFLLAFSWTLLRIWAIKKNLGKENFRTLALSIPVILIAIEAYILHITRYAGSDLALQNVFLFWIIGALFSVMIGSYIPFWAMHLVNNLVFDLKIYLSNEAIKVWFIAVLVLLIALYVYLYAYLPMKKRKEVKNNIPV